MRLLRFCTNYPVYLHQFYHRQPYLARQNYAAQYRALMDDCYGWADFWTKALYSLGYEVWEPVGNAEPQQKAWAHEQGIGYHRKSWLLEIALAQAKHFRPDIILVNDYLTYTADFFRTLRRECPSVRRVIGWCGAPYDNIEVFREYDLILSNIPALVSDFRSKGLHAEYFCHGFEPQILERIQNVERRTVDFSFIGSVVKFAHFHREREQLLLRLVERANLTLWLDAARPPLSQRILLPLRQSVFRTVRLLQRTDAGQRLIKQVAYLKSYSALEHVPDLTHYADLRLLAVAHQPVFGMDMFRTLRASKVTLNTHIDLATEHASNMRLFEATGVGTCLLTDWKPNLPEFFQPDVEVVAYRSSAEATEKLRYLLEHEDERRRIAAAGQRRTLACHTIAQRAQELDRLMRFTLKTINRRRSWGSCSH